jgi:hypothetical protein
MRQVLAGIKSVEDGDVYHVICRQLEALDVVRLGEKRCGRRRHFTAFYVHGPWDLDEVGLGEENCRRAAYFDTLQDGSWDLDAASLGRDESYKCGGRREKYLNRTRGRVELRNS